MSRNAVKAEKKRYIQTVGIKEEAYMNKKAITKFISYLNKDKIANVVGHLWALGIIFTIFDMFCLQFQFRLFVTYFFYYITPIVTIVIIVRVIILFRRFKATII